MTDTLDELTGISEKDRKKALRWWLARSEPETVRIYNCVIKKCYQLEDSCRKRGQDIDKQLLRYAALVSVVRDAGWDAVAGKGYRIAKTKHLEDLERLRKSQIVPKKRGRPAKLLAKVLGCRAVIKTCRENGLSYAALAEHLKKHNRLDISPEHLRNIMIEHGI
jgi:hypothetical protein